MNRELAIGHMLDLLTEDDYRTACKVVGDKLARIHRPDLIISPDGNPYLFRWYLVPEGGAPEDMALTRALVMFHIQVASDPERPLHDHPWDNQSVILSGSYEELLQSDPPYGPTSRELRLPGDVITRGAREAHRLILPPGVPYTMTIFSTGPKVRKWGFWYGNEWHPYERHVETRDGVSVHVNRED